ncbi:orotate phosphoribosyltransferase [Candidatus Entotheonella palauensis]|uniref:orotate phosphoribosyltransferase n=1 Tax=Candidatus Entotheonella palauensis TaxID=93172 RepID=UPI00277B51B1|nr:phosphoribosyltransferase family protein [Candidatus Entotheonella palauensis]
MMTRDQLARQIYTASNITGTFQLRSGAMADEYFDKYRFEADPGLLSAVAQALHPLIPPETDALAGLELGGIPLVTMLSQIAQRPARFVRKAAKPYGTCQLAEGGEIAGYRLLLIEDVVTSGGQIIESTQALRQLGARITHALCVIDREMGGAERLAAIDVTLIPLFRASELKAAAQDMT